MNSKEFEMLGKVFQAEFNSGFNNGVHLYQTKSKVAEKLESNGLIHKRKITLWGKLPVVIEGYELTEHGRYEYCSNCD